MARSSRCGVSLANDDARRKGGLGKWREFEGSKQLRTEIYWKTPRPSDRRERERKGVKGRASLRLRPCKRQTDLGEGVAISSSVMDG